MKNRFLSAICLLALLIAPLSAQAACGYSWTTENPHKVHYCTRDDDQNWHRIIYRYYDYTTHQVIIIHQDDSDTTDSEMIRREQHMEEIDKGFPATCLSSGLKDGTHCPLCKYVTKKQDVISPTGHTRVVDPEVPATCTQPGKTIGAHCSVCGAVILAQQDVEKLPHTEVVDPAVAPKPGVAGKTEGKHCSVCNEVIVPQQEIPALATATPAATPTAKPTALPTAKPTEIPTQKPTEVPTAKPTALPTAKPTEGPAPAACIRHVYGAWRPERDGHTAKCRNCETSGTVDCTFLTVTVNGEPRQICPICGKFGEEAFSKIIGVATGYNKPRGSVVLRDLSLPFGMEKVQLNGWDAEAKVLWAFTAAYSYSGKPQPWPDSMRLTLPAGAPGGTLLRVDCNGQVSRADYRLENGRLIVTATGTALYLMVE